MTPDPQGPGEDVIGQQDTAYLELKRLALALARPGSTPPEEWAFAAWIVLEAMAPDDYEVARRAHGILTAWLEWCLGAIGKIEPPEAVTLLHALTDYLYKFGGWTREDGKWRSFGPPATEPDEPDGDDLPWRDPGYEHYIVVKS